MSRRHAILAWVPWPALKPAMRRMTRRHSLWRSVPWPVCKGWAAVRIAAHGLVRWRWDWFRCAWHVLTL